MDCRGFESRLDAFLEDTLSGTERREAEAHLDSCARCRELGSLARGGPDLAGVPAPPDLAGQVMARTGASPCARAHGLMGDHVDGVLEPVDAELMGLHLDGCESCEALARAVARLGDELPRLAEMEPDGRFLPEVLAQTSRRPRPVDTLAAQWSRWTQWATAWTRLVQRPRFALEGAYIGALVLLLLFGAPFSPFHDVPAKALAAVRQGPEAADLPPEVTELAERGGRAWDTTRRTVRGSYDGIRDGLREGAGRIGSTARDLGQDGKEIGRAVLDGDFDLLLEKLRPGEPDGAGEDEVSTDKQA